MLRKETEYANQAEGNEVIQTADISEHHGAVVYDPLLDSHLVWKIYCNGEIAIVYIHILCDRIGVQIVDSLRWRQAHKIKPVIIQLSLDLI